jgi:hypothetical protein
MNEPEPEPEHVTKARALVDEATHATEHITRPDWCLDGAVPATQMTTDRGTLRITRESCRYCLADQAAALGVGLALEAYLNTLAPQPPLRLIAEELEARRRADAEHEATMHDAYLTIEEYESMSHAERAVYDLIDNECGGHHANIPGLVQRLVAAVVRGNIEDAITDVYRAEAGDGIVDVPLFTVEGEAPR